MHAMLIDVRHAVLVLISKSFPCFIFPKEGVRVRVGEFQEQIQELCLLNLIILVLEKSSIENSNLSGKINVT